MQIESKVTLALIFTVFVQTASALVWAGHAAERLSRVERDVVQEVAIVERLARLEEQVVDARAALVRIESALNGQRGRR